MPNKLNRGLAYTLLTACLCFSSVANAGQADLDAEAKQILTDFQSKSQPMRAIVQRIKWSGLTNAALFDAMEAELLARYATDTTAFGVEYCSWLVQALAFSGLTKYQATLEKVQSTAKDKKLLRYAQSSLVALPKFVKFNPVIIAGVDQEPVAGFSKRRALNMLHADEPELMRAGAGIALDRFAQDASVTDVVRDRLLARYKDADTSDAVADATAWMCKVLGQSGNAAYAPVLKEVADNGKASTLRRWADKSLKMLNEATAPSPTSSPTSSPTASPTA